VFRNLGAALAASNASFHDLVKLTDYVVDLDHLPEIREVRDRPVNPTPPPTSTAVQVGRPFRPEFLLEVDAIAVVKWSVVRRARTRRGPSHPRRTDGPAPPPVR
jgi:enamine deaminase RidA (YjgF/YER057c/UK114 family)